MTHATVDLWVAVLGGVSAIIVAFVMTRNTVSKIERNTRPSNGTTLAQTVEATQLTVHALVDGQHQLGQHLDVVRGDLGEMDRLNSEQHQAILREQERVAEELRRVPRNPCP